MQLQTISPPAYLLIRAWEKEDKKLFRKFRRQEGTMMVINALAEMITRDGKESLSKNLAHF